MYDYQGRKRRSDAGILQLTERDVTVLTWVAEQYCISFDHLRLLLGKHPKATTKKTGILGISSTREIIERWIQLELIDPPKKILTEHAPYIWLSRRGLAQLGLPYAYCQPKPSTIQHIYAVNSIRLYLERWNLSLWYSTRLLTRLTNYRPVPDAELRTDTTIIALQVMERTRPLALQEEINTLCTLASRENGTTPYYAHFWYFLHVESVSLFQRELSTLDTALQQRVRVYPIDTQREKTRPQLEGWTQPPTQDSAV